MTDPNPHAERRDKAGFVDRSVWRNRTMSLSSSKWGFAVSVQSQNVFVSVLESAWVWLWELRPFRWLVGRSWGYNLWNKGIILCDGKEVGYLPITDEQARSFYPDDKSFNEDWGWTYDD